MLDSFEERILAMVEHAEEVEILAIDFTSVLFIAKLKDKFGTRYHRGVFYPKEAPLNTSEHDDFELEIEGIERSEI